MKALLSPLAKAVLDDPRTRAKLLEFLTTKSDPKAWPNGGPVLEVRFKGRLIAVRAKVVPKAR